MLVADVARANPIIASFGDDDRCDNPGNQSLTEELGGTHTPDPGLIQTGGETASPFALNEWISWTSIDVSQTICDAAPGINDNEIDWLVSITNETNRIFEDLYFVTDSLGVNQIGNVDGTIDGLEAFKIDSTGINDNLVSESLAANGIFQPGEVWSFIVKDFVDVGGLGRSPFFGSLGVGSGDPDSNANIVVGDPDFPPIPEPSTLLSLGLLSLAGLGLRRKNKN